MFGIGSANIENEQGQPISIGNQFIEDFKEYFAIKTT